MNNMTSNQLVMTAKTRFACGGLTFALLTLASALSGNAQTIFSDSFTPLNPDVPTLLNGRVVETGTGVYVASPTETVSGGHANVQNQAGFIAFTPVTGNVYTLSADLFVSDQNLDGDGNATNVGPLSLGFANDPGLLTGAAAGAGWFQGTTDPSGWLFTNFIGNGAVFGGPDTANGGSAILLNAGGIIHNYRITLDTTNVSSWTFSFLADGNQIGTPISVAPGDININYVGFGTTFAGDAAPGSFVDNFTLTSAVPEPSTYALMGLGAFGLYSVRRRIRRAA